MPTHDEAGEQGKDRLGRRGGQEVDTRSRCRRVPDRLKPNRHKLDDSKQRSHEAEHEPHGARDRSHAYDSQWDCSPVALAYLNKPPEQNADAKDAEGEDDPPIAPGVLTAAPLERQEKANERWHQEAGAEEVKLLESLVDAAAGLGVWVRRQLDQEENDEKCDTSEGQVDPETPSPCCIVREHATERWGDDLGDPRGAADGAGDLGSIVQWYALGQDDESPRYDPRAPQPSNSATDDQSEGVWGRRAYDRADFEEAQRSHEHPFDIELGVELPKHELEATGRKEVSRPIPSYIIERVELDRDLGNCGSDDSPVLLSCKLYGLPRRGQNSPIRRTELPELGRHKSAAEKAHGDNCRLFGARIPPLPCYLAQPPHRVVPRRRSRWGQSVASSPSINLPWRAFLVY